MNKVTHKTTLNTMDATFFVIKSFYVQRSIHCTYTLHANKYRVFVGKFVSPLFPEVFSTEGKSFLLS
jgi:hypothetical protein